MLVGKGILCWSREERVTNRYGSIHLNDRPYEGSAQASADVDVPTLTALDGKRVRIACKVIESRQSSHVGDKFLHLKPVQPDTGEVIELGVGFLSIQRASWDASVIEICLRPNDGREDLWINPRVLYRLHDQTVEVYAEETGDDFTPVAEDLFCEIGVEDLGDGSFQTKKARAPLHLPVEIERLGDGLFAMHPYTFMKGRRIA